MGGDEAAGLRASAAAARAPAPLAAERGAAAARAPAPFPATPPPPPSARALQLRVRALGLAFFFLFASYIAVQLLQTTVNADVGYICNLAVYLCFAASSLTAPFVVARLGPSRCLGASAVIYVLQMVANIDPLPAPLLASCAATGLAGGTLWIGQAAFVGSAAGAYAVAAGKSLSDASSELNSAFFFAFQVSGCIGTIFASVLMLTAPGARGALFGVLTASGATGALLLAALAPPDSPGEAVLLWSPWARRADELAKGEVGADAAAAPPAAASAPPASAGAFVPLAVSAPPASAAASAPPAASASAAASTPPAASAPLASPAPSAPMPLSAFAHFVASQPRLVALAPLFFAMGAFQAVGFSTLTGAVVVPQLGAGWVGFVGAAYSASASAFVLALPLVTLRPRIGRRWAVALAAAIWAVTLACLLAWVAAYDPRRDPPPRAAAFAALFAASCALGAGDGAMQALMSATLQTWWPARVPSALAFMRSCMALGTATVAGVGARAEPGVRECPTTRKSRS